MAGCNASAKSTFIRTRLNEIRISVSEVQIDLERNLRYKFLKETIIGSASPYTNKHWLSTSLRLLIHQEFQLQCEI